VVSTEPELQLDAPAVIQQITTVARTSLVRGNRLDIEQFLVFIPQSIARRADQNAKCNCTLARAAELHDSVILRLIPQGPFSVYK
jgi:hypothetical protein